MKTRTILLVAAAMAFSASVASAEETIVHEHTAPGLSVQVPGVGVTVGTPDTRTEHRVIDNSGSSDCRTKTVHKEDEAGSTTVRKERCD